MKAIIALCVSLAVFPVLADELRVWTDKTGKTIEAVHVRTLGDQVVLRKADGSELRVSLDTLSERDRRYAVLLTPPRLELSVSRKKSSTNSSGPGNYGPGMQKTDEVISVTATVRKSSPSTYEAPLRAELYLIGSRIQNEGYIILDKTVERLSYTADPAASRSFSSPEINLQQIEFRQKRGVEYEGYLLAVMDKTGDVIAMKCSKLDFEKNADAILDADKGSFFDERFVPAGWKEVDPRRREDGKEERFMPRKRFYRGF